MDLKALISKSTGKQSEAPRIRLVEDSRVPSNTVEILTDKAVTEFVQQANEVCACGHPEDAHGPDCEILECDCTSFCPSSHSYDINSPASSSDSAGTESKQGEGVGVSDLPPTTPEVELVDVLLGALDEQLVKEQKVTTTSDLLHLPEPNPDMMPDGYCQHLCDCGKWWTHGAANKCRYPDVLIQGKCQHCLSGRTDQIDVTEDLKDGKLTPIAQIKTRNDERERCKDMSIEQLTHHIEFLAQQIESLRVRSMETRKMRSDLEEEELANIPESEREKFIQELRLGQKAAKKVKAVKTPRVKKVSPADQIAATKASLIADGIPSGLAENMASLMIRLGKSRAEVEAFLND